MSARIEEIRAENENGGVADADVEWLCRVAEAAERILTSTDPLIARSDLRRVLDQRIIWDGPNQRWAVYT